MINEKEVTAYVTIPDCFMQGCSEDRLLRSKCFHYVRIGGQYRISKKSFDNWLDGKEGGTEDGIC